MRLVVLALILAAPATAQTAPVEHRLSPEAIAAAQAEGESRNRAADLLATTRGDTRLALPLERPRDRRIHGEAGFGIDSAGGRAVFGELSTQLGDGVNATVAGDYSEYRAPFRVRQRNR